MTPTYVLVELVTDIPNVAAMVRDAVQDMLIEDGETVRTADVTDDLAFSTSAITVHLRRDLA